MEEVPRAVGMNILATGKTHLRKSKLTYWHLVYTSVPRLACIRLLNTYHSTLHCNSNTINSSIYSKQFSDFLGNTKSCAILPQSIWNILITSKKKPHNHQHSLSVFLPSPWALGNHSFFFCCYEFTCSGHLKWNHLTCGLLWLASCT